LASISEETLYFSHCWIYEASSWHL